MPLLLGNFKTLIEIISTICRKTNPKCLLLKTSVKEDLNQWFSNILGCGPPIEIFLYSVDPLLLTVIQNFESYGPLISSVDH